jgi:arylsulfatase A-like enzyme
MARRSPNILVLISDQHRADMMGCAGDSAVRTPIMDRLASQRVRFARVVVDPLDDTPAAPGPIRPRN